MPNPTHEDLAEVTFCDALANLSRSKWPKLLADMLDVAEAALKRETVSADLAEKLARSTVLGLAIYFGGRQIYVPVGQKLRQALRDDEIYRAFGREAVEDIAKTHGITTVRAYQINAEQRKLRRGRV
ncbi:MAG: hypothetical protein EKK46_06315 [Rhodocyclaceae bacterium]|nr:MAG: hypothetical protein EKK46_06315 [Rhodocyclaceae bacterium]